MDLSIIVPVYNVEAYLEKCLKSLVEQTLSSNRYEIIVVNDGSPDGSQTIIDKFAKEYSNIVALQKQNGGLSDARNYGIDRATGQYIAFVDSDDYVDVHMYEAMLNKAKEQDFDMVVCDFTEVYDDKIVPCTSRLKEDLMTQKDVRHAMVDFYPSAWNKIYKKELFKEIRYKKGVWFEDVECLYRLFPIIRNVGVIKEPLYFYIQREGSISKATDQRIYHYIDNWNGILEYYKHKGYMQTYQEEIEYCYVRYVYATFIKSCLKYDKKAYRQAVALAIGEVKKHFKKYRLNSYFYKTFKGIYCVMFNKFLGEMLYLLKNR